MNTIADQDDKSATSTGISAFDQHLKSLDYKLWGNAAVRQITLEEVKDHLLEHYHQLLDQGVTSEEAAKQALKGFSSVDEIKKTQHQEKLNTLCKYFFLFGLPFAVMMSFMPLAIEGSKEGWQVIVFTFLFCLVFFGGGMGITFTFFYTPVKPTQSLKINNLEETLTVVMSDKSKKIAIFMMPLMTFVSILILLGGFDRGWIAGMNPIYSTVLAVMGLKVVLAHFSAWTVLSVNQHQLDIKTLFGHRSLSLHQVNVFKRMNVFLYLLYPVMGSVYTLVTTDEQGNTQRAHIMLDAEMHNSDQLIAHLDSLKNIGQ
ncbi:MAG TPA: permease prefix domain 1-containing protein [Cellvibrionaceae bacterium]